MIKVIRFVYCGIFLTIIVLGIISFSYFVGNSILSYALVVFAFGMFFFYDLKKIYSENNKEKDSQIANIISLLNLVSTYDYNNLKYIKLITITYDQNTLNMIVTLKDNKKYADAISSLPSSQEELIDLDNRIEEYY